MCIPLQDLWVFIPFGTDRSILVYLLVVGVRFGTFRVPAGDKGARDPRWLQTNTVRRREARSQVVAPPFPVAGHPAPSSDATHRTGVAPRDGGAAVAAIDLARSHVERCLQDLWSVERVLPDADGDYCYGSGTAACYVGLDAAEPVVVNAVACAAVEVKKTAKLLEELNEVNARCRMAHVYWTNGAVLVEQTLFADTVSRGSLAHAGQSVAHIANDLGPMIAAVYGGHTPLVGDTAPEAAE